MIPDGDATPDRSRSAAGVPAFVASAYEAHHGEVFAFLVRATRDEAAAEADLEETYFQLAKETRDGLAPDAVRGWLYRTAAGLVTDRGERQTRSARVPGPEASRDIEAVLGGLSLDARVALLLAGAGFSGREIAVMMDRSVAATRTLLGRARARVRIRRELFAVASR